MSGTPVDAVLRHPIDDQAISLWQEGGHYAKGFVFLALELHREGLILGQLPSRGSACRGAIISLWLKKLQHAMSGTSVLARCCLSHALSNALRLETRDIF